LFYPQHLAWAATNRGTRGCAARSFRHSRWWLPWPSPAPLLLATSPPQRIRLTARKLAAVGMLRPASVQRRRCKDLAVCLNYAGASASAGALFHLDHCRSGTPWFKGDWRPRGWGLHPTARQFLVRFFSTGCRKRMCHAAIGHYAIRRTERGPPDSAQYSQAADAVTQVARYFISAEPEQ
jgi:hypothetical protein